ncbi:hypothetical protein DPMN_043414 [Dreissena polymorpha]|uniref:Uncharacterized protein n=1 Tax=Dreissena polymorpha TaxID=45954 RepID=A0A9D4HVK2_DREPO|nr:hypothetical protein DPMN_043414 [Dreissena polymorpha]
MATFMPRQKEKNRAVIPMPAAPRGMNNKQPAYLPASTTKLDYKNYTMCGNMRKRVEDALEDKEKLETMDAYGLARDAVHRTACIFKDPVFPSVMLLGQMLCPLPA